MWTDDPIADYERYEREQQRQLERLPKCSDCGQHIQDEEAYYLNGEWICLECGKWIDEAGIDFHLRVVEEVEEEW